MSPHPQPRCGYFTNSLPSNVLPLCLYDVHISVSLSTSHARCKYLKVQISRLLLVNISLYSASEVAKYNLKKCNAQFKLANTRICLKATCCIDSYCEIESKVSSNKHKANRIMLYRVSSNNSIHIYMANIIIFFFSILIAITMNPPLKV